jgi:hypothetical protein
LAHSLPDQSGSRFAALPSGVAHYRENDPMRNPFLCFFSKKGLFDGIYIKKAKGEYKNSPFGSKTSAN